MIIYDSLYELLNTYIYGAPEVLSTYQELVLTNCATIGSLFVVGLPFVAIFIAFKFIIFLTRGW